jgi:predicted nucleic acid-binding protein
VDKIDSSMIFSSLLAGFKDGIEHVIAAFNDVHVPNNTVDAERSRTSTLTQMLNIFDPFVPKAGI